MNSIYFSIIYALIVTSSVVAVAVQSWAASYGVSQRKAPYVKAPAKNLWAKLST